MVLIATRGLRTTFNGTRRKVTTESHGERKGGPDGKEEKEDS